MLRFPTPLVDAGDIFSDRVSGDIRIAPRPRAIFSTPLNRTNDNDRDIFPPKGRDTPYRDIPFTLIGKVAGGGNDRDAQVKKLFHTIVPSLNPCIVVSWRVLKCEQYHSSPLQFFFFDVLNSSLHAVSKVGFFEIPSYLDWLDCYSFGCSI